MALQSSGEISIDDIRTEIGTTNGSLRSLSSTAGKSTPDAMSEFYGYSHSGVYSDTFYYDSSSDPCPLGTATTIYWGSSGDPYTNNVTIYSNSSLTTNAPAGYYWSPITSYVNLWLGSSWASYNAGCSP